MIDWSKAPKGTTHCDLGEPKDDENRWMKYDGDNLFTFDSGFWKLFSTEPSVFLREYVKKPTTCPYTDLLKLCQEAQMEVDFMAEGMYVVWDVDREESTQLTSIDAVVSLLESSKQFHEAREQYVWE